MAAYVYGLTALTGRKRNQGRKVVVNGFEFGRRALVLAGIGIGISLLPALVATVLFGPIGFIVTFGVVVPATYWLIDGRAKKDSDLPMYKALLNKRRFTPRLLVCWTPIPTSSQLGTAVRASVPQQPVPARPGDAVWGQRNARPATRTFDYLGASK